MKFSMSMFLASIAMCVSSVFAQTNNVTVELEKWSRTDSILKASVIFDGQDPTVETTELKMEWYDQATGNTNWGDSVDDSTRVSDTLEAIDIGGSCVEFQDAGAMYLTVKVYEQCGTYTVSGWDEYTINLQGYTDELYVDASEAEADGMTGNDDIILECSIHIDGDITRDETRLKMSYWDNSAGIAGAWILAQNKIATFDTSNFEMGWGAFKLEGAKRGESGIPDTHHIKLELVQDEGVDEVILDTRYFYVDES